MPLTFWLFAALIVIIGFGVVNNYYWKNVREDFQYRQRRWREKQQLDA